MHTHVGGHWDRPPYLFVRCLGIRFDAAQDYRRCCSFRDALIPYTFQLTGSLCTSGFTEDMTGHSAAGHEFRVCIVLVPTAFVPWCSVSLPDTEGCCCCCFYRYTFYDIPLRDPYVRIVAARGRPALFSSDLRSSRHSQQRQVMRSYALILMQTTQSYLRIHLLTLCGSHR